MKLKNLQDAFVHELRDLYSAETQLVKALPKMAESASSEELGVAIQEHLEETQNQVDRLKQIFDDLDVSPNGEKCKAMEGLIEEGKKVLEEDASPEVLDALIISIAQKIEHYEIAGYGTARTFAERLGHTDAANLLQETLDEESAADEKLTEIAESAVNEEAESTDS